MFVTKSTAHCIKCFVHFWHLTLKCRFSIDNLVIFDVFTISLLSLHSVAYRLVVFLSFCTSALLMDSLSMFLFCICFLLFVWLLSYLHFQDKKKDKVPSTTPFSKYKFYLDVHISKAKTALISDVISFGGVSYFLIY